MNIDNELLNQIKITPIIETLHLENISDDDLFELSNTIIEKNPQRVIALTKKILDNGNDPMQIMKELVEYLSWYNEKRIKVKLKGLTPLQFRNQSLKSA